MYDREMAGEGDLVWHYCDGVGMKSILENRVLWASSAAYMNDFKELISGDDVLARSYDELRLEFSESEHEELRRTITNFSSPREEKFILSGSRDPDSLTLWRYYGRDQVSFAVGLDRTVSFDVRAQKKRDKHPYPPSGYLDGPQNPDGSLEEHPDQDGQVVEPWAEMIYSPEKQRQIISRALNNLSRALREARIEERRFSFRVYSKNSALQSELSRIKDHGFRDERELRVIAQLNPHWKYVLHRPGRFGMVPYIELGLPVGGASGRGRLFALNGQQKMHRLPIRQVNIGPTPFPDEARFGLQQLLTFLGYHDVKVVVSKIPYR